MFDTLSVSSFDTIVDVSCQLSPPELTVLVSLAPIADSRFVNDSRREEGEDDFVRCSAVAIFRQEFFFWGGGGGRGIRGLHRKFGLV